MRTNSSENIAQTGSSSALAPRCPTRGPTYT
eukprot:COSAG03_NODE_27271_length_254_cov_0.664516_1_plen_30_part_10